MIMVGGESGNGLLDDVQVSEHLFSSCCVLLACRLEDLPRHENTN